MAVKVSVKDLPRDRQFEPCFEFNFGITDENTDTKHGYMVLAHLPPKSESRFHYHTGGDI